jgi:hypothetical protein
LWRVPAAVVPSAAVSSLSVVWCCGVGCTPAGSVSLAHMLSGWGLRCASASILASAAGSSSAVVWGCGDGGTPARSVSLTSMSAQSSPLPRGESFAPLPAPCCGQAGEGGRGGGDPIVARGVGEGGHDGGGEPVGSAMCISSRSLAYGARWSARMVRVALGPVWYGGPGWVVATSLGCEPGVWLPSSVLVPSRPESRVRLCGAGGSVPPGREPGVSSLGCEPGVCRFVFDSTSSLGCEPEVCRVVFDSTSSLGCEPEVCRVVFVSSSSLGCEPEVCWLVFRLVFFSGV